MLTHIVCWKYNAITPSARREEHLARLSALPGIIPDIISFSVGTDILHLDRSFDTGLVAVFSDREALDAYANNPAHLEVVAIGKEISQQVVSVDFLNE